MGARKQRWSEEEEKTLKAGIQKHGAGKWTAILKDPEFKSTLCARSNVDLKDKYRNMCVVRTGEGSREKTMGVAKRSKLYQMQDNNHVTLRSNNEDFINEMNVVKLLTTSTDFELPSQNKQKSSLELLIPEAIACLKETGGSSVPSIASYIVDNLKVVPKSKRAIGENLKALVEAGKLVKVNSRYKLAQNADLSKGRSPNKPIEAKLKVSVKSDGDLKNVSKSSNNVRLSRSEGDLKNVCKSSMSEGLSKSKGDVNVNILADNEGLPTYEDRTALKAEGDLKNVCKSSMNEGLSRSKGDVNVNILADNEGLPTYEDRTALKAAGDNEGLPTYKDRTAHEAAADNEGSPTHENRTAHEAAADNEGSPTHENRTAHEAAEAVAKAEVSRAEYGEALRRLKLAEAFVSASHSLLEKLSMEMSRRNAKVKEADT